MKYLPNRFQCLIPISKVIAALAIFFVIALAVSPAKIYTAIFYLRIFIPIAVIISLYLFFISKSTSVTVDNSSLTLEITFSRCKTITIPFDEISTCEIKQNFIEKLISLYGININILSTEPENQKNASIVSQYMVFDKTTAEEIIKIINSYKN